MTSDQEREELHHEKLFENNIMPKLIREYMDTGVKVPFDLKGIRGFPKRKDFRLEHGTTGTCKVL